MQVTIDRQRNDFDRRSLQPFPLALIGVVLLFLAAPWSIQHKAHMALHGLCAQTPSHTLLLGGRPLPFDSRMTGIYGGFVATMVVLVLMGRHRASRLPSIPVCGVLALFVGLMAIDGFNSLFLDLQRPHLYEPDNWLRLITGVGCGITLGSVVCYLFAISLWRTPQSHVPVVKVRDFVFLLPVQLPFIALALSGIELLAFPMTLFLVIAAVLVLSSLALVAIVLFRYQDCSFSHPGELQPTATAALFTAIAVMALLSGGRFMLEHLLNLQPLT
jgi:uncharacterized membrane protein